MSSYNSRKCASCIVAITAVGFIVGIIGTVLYFVELHRINCYSYGECTVVKIGTVFRCSTTRTGSKRRGNTHTSCSYYGIWDVNYYVKELDRKIYSDIESMYGYAHSGIAYNAANKEHPINSNSSCWYNGCSSPSDDTNYYEVQWYKPNDKVAFYTMIGGFGTMVLMLLGWLMYYLIQCCSRENVQSNPRYMSSYNNNSLLSNNHLNYPSYNSVGESQSSSFINDEDRYCTDIIKGTTTTIINNLNENENNNESSSNINSNNRNFGPDSEGYI